MGKCCDAFDLGPSFITTTPTHYSHYMRLTERVINKPSNIPINYVGVLNLTSVDERINVTVNVHVSIGACSNLAGNFPGISCCQLLRHILSKNVLTKLHLTKCIMNIEYFEVMIYLLVHLPCQNT